MDAISVKELTKSYRIGVGRARVREMLPYPIDRATRGLFPRWWARDTFNALDGVSFSATSGSSLGIVGHNGAGKTTLLKVIAGVTEPSAGAVHLSGRVAALIDVLVGFHPDLTGRENVFLLGAVHGFGRRAMRSRIEDVLEFAEIGDLADTPLKRYSAGMMARLGFGTMTALDIDVLLVDEVLAVGDAAFQRKCIRWLDEYRTRGGTLVFVSHNLSLVRNMTDRVIWLTHGRLTGDGPTSETLGRYARAMERRDVGPPAHRREAANKLMVSRGFHRWGAGGARVREVHVDDQPRNDSTVSFLISYETSGLEHGVFCVGFLDEAGHEIGAASSPLLTLSRPQGSIVCRIRPLPLRSGIYFPVVAILSTDGVVRDRWQLERAIVVDGNGSELIRDFGPVQITAGWSRP